MIKTDNQDVEQAVRVAKEDEWYMTGFK